MRVPKMVKNGFNSVLQTFAGSRRLVAARNSGTMRSPKLSPNHKRRIKTILHQFRNSHARYAHFNGAVAAEYLIAALFVSRITFKNLPILNKINQTRFTSKLCCAESLRRFWHRQSTVCFAGLNKAQCQETGLSLSSS